MRRRLDGGTDEGLVAALTPAFEPFFEAAEEELVDFDLIEQRAALRGDHRAAQLVQDQPRRLVAGQAELALDDGWQAYQRIAKLGYDIARSSRGPPLPASSCYLAPTAPSRT